jgi:NAD-dependent dihydropyrimidine dehydrogenase PreA subunit/flavodoxin
MIYYFSGTGNSQWIAQQLASKTDDLAVNMMDCSVVTSIENQTVGVVFPIYAWGAPEPVLEFVKKLAGKPVFAFGVCTCGTDAGYAMKKINSIFPLNSTYSVAMPSNYIIGSDVESEESATSKIEKAKERINTIAHQINTKQSVDNVNTGKLPWVKSVLANFGFNKFARSTKPFYVTEKCIACGQCAENCPANTIRMIDGKPHWGQRCYQCTACINRCPVKAIEYGKGTAARSRYQFKETGV